MKAQPITFENGTVIPVEPARATHIKIQLPGPSGTMCLPVMIKGTREGTGNWTWNGDIERPTLKPSVLSQSGHFAPEFKSGDSCWCKYYDEHPKETPVFHCYRCHTWINEGKVQFLNDSTHELAGQTLDLIEL